MFEIEILAPFEEVKIGTEVFRIDFSDKSIARISTEFIEKMNEIEAINEKRESDPNAMINASEHLEKSKLLLCQVCDIFFGGNAGERLYKASGNSVYTVLRIVCKVADIFDDRIKKVGIQANL